MDLLQVAVILRTAAHAQHQQLELVIFREPVFFQYLADVLPVPGDNALLHP